MDEKRIKKILIIKASALGDVVRTFPSIIFVREKFPRAHIAYMTGEPFVELLEPCPHIDELIPYKKRRNTEDIGGFIRFAIDIRRRRFDLVLNLQNTRRFDYIAKISGAREQSRIVDIDRPMDGVQGVFEILRSAGLEPGEPKYEFWLKPEDVEFAEKFVSGEGLSGARIIGLNPGVAWPSRQWPLEHYAAVADRAQAELGARIVVFGNASEVERAEKIASLMKTAPPPAIAAGKTTIRQAAAIIKRCAAFVSNDSGLMHIAAMSCVPTVGIFGPSTPDIARPSGPGHKVHYLALPCAPCYKHECPEGTLECMKNINPNDVFEDVKYLFLKTPNN